MNLKIAEKRNTFTIATRANSVVSRGSTKQSASSFPVKNVSGNNYS